MIMKRKLYICPQVEVVRINTSLMQAFKEASMPKDPFSSAPKRRTEVF